MELAPEAIKCESSKFWKASWNPEVTPGPMQRCSLLAAPCMHTSLPPPPSPWHELPQENLPEPQGHSVTSSFILIPSEKFKNYTKKYFSLCYLLTKNTPQNYKLFSGLLEFWLLVEGVVCTLWERNGFTGGRGTKDRKSDNGIWHYIFSYTIQLFIMMPVRTEEFCPHLTPSSVYVCKMERKTAQCRGRRGRFLIFIPVYHKSEKAALVKCDPCPPCALCSCCSLSPCLRYQGAELPCSNGLQLWKRRILF